MTKQTSNALLRENLGSIVLTSMWLVCSIGACLPAAPSFVSFLQMVCTAIVALACIEIVLILFCRELLHIPRVNVPFRMRMGFLFANLICVVFTVANQRYVETVIALFALLAHEMLDRYDTQ